MSPITTAPEADPVSALALALGPHAAAFSLEWIDRCASSNAELLNRPLLADDRLHVLITDQQDAGRGRRGRQWLSWSEGSLTFSVLWQIPPGAPAPTGLSLVVGLAVARALEDLGVAGVQLKWPNDVLIHGSKIAGILIELVSQNGRPAAAVIGIGANLRLPEGVQIPGQPAVTDLWREIGTSAPDRITVLAAILGQLRGLLDTYAVAGFGALRGAWEQRNAHAGLPVWIAVDGEAAAGTCVGVDDDGALLLRTAEGMRRILAGDVSLRPGGESKT